MTDNAEQIEFWNGEAGETWVKVQHRVDAMLQELSSLAIVKANPQAGEAAIDVGCGCGTTTLALASGGASVLGVDISAPMLARAQERAVGLDNVVFTRADAASHAFSPDYQLIFSRFGVMFFADPEVAFANLRSALSDTGRMVFVCWQPPSANPWMSVAGRAIKPFLQPAPAVDPRAPGPFAFADAEYVRGILDQAGFQNVVIESVTVELHVGDDLDSAIRSQGQIGPLAHALDELSEDVREQALAAVREAFTPLMSDAGLNLGAAVWLVSATSNG